MPTLDVLLVRHGQSESNAGLKSLDPVSIPLTSRGKRHADAVSQWISTRPAKIITSHYKRSQQTAEIINAKFPDSPSIHRPVHEFTFLASDNYFQTNVAERKSMIEQYWNSGKPYRVNGPGAESFAQFIERVVSFRNQLLQEETGPVVVCSHKKFLSALVWVLINGEPKISARRMRRFRGFDLGMSIKNGAIIPVCIRNGVPSVGPAETAHLNGV